jgi:hypothetical protein
LQYTYFPLQNYTTASISKLMESKVTPLYAMKVHREVELQFHSFLNSAVDGDRWSAYASAAVFQGTELLIPFSKRLGGTQSQYGQCPESNPGSSIP